MRKKLLLVLLVFVNSIPNSYAFRFPCTMNVGGGIVCDIESTFCGCTGNPNGHDWLSINGNVLTVGLDALNLEHTNPKVMIFFKNKYYFTIKRVEGVV